jgi:hypothetical protein
MAVVGIGKERPMRLICGRFSQDVVFGSAGIAKFFPAAQMTAKALRGVLENRAPRAGRFTRGDDR